MSTASSPALAQSDSFPGRVRHFVIGMLFAAALLIPKLLQVRRNTRSWMALRILLALAGASLVLFPLGSNDSFLPAVFGLSMFLAAILLPPAKPVDANTDIARQLGTLVVVNGGRFKLGTEGTSFAARLFVGSEHLSVRDAQLVSRLEIPVAEITSAQAEESHGHWFLRVNWSSKTAVFSYRGVFAERLARVAETAIAGVLRPALPVPPRSRAANA
jgi:hypothetical protein